MVSAVLPFRRTRTVALAQALEAQLGRLIMANREREEHRARQRKLATAALVAGLWLALYLLSPNLAYGGASAVCAVWISWHVFLIAQESKRAFWNHR